MTWFVFDFRIGKSKIMDEIIGKKIDPLIFI